MGLCREVNGGIWGQDIAESGPSPSKQRVFRDSFGIATGTHSSVLWDRWNFPVRLLDHFG